MSGALKLEDLCESLSEIDAFPHVPLAATNLAIAICWLIIVLIAIPGAIQHGDGESDENDHKSCFLFFDGTMILILPLISIFIITTASVGIGFHASILEPVQSFGEQGCKWCSSDNRCPDLQSLVIANIVCDVLFILFGIATIALGCLFACRTMFSSMNDPGDGDGVNAFYYLAAHSAMSVCALISTSVLLWYAVTISLRKSSKGVCDGTELICTNTTL